MQASEDTVTGAEDADSEQDLGARLRSAREAQELSLEDLSAELRITAEHLGALEQSRYEALGAPVFAKGYLKQYAARLGLDVAAIAAEYDRTAGRPGIDIAPSKSIRLRDERQITLWIVAGLALALLAVFLVLWWLRQGDEPAASAVLPATAGEVAPPGATPAASSAPVSQPAASGSSEAPDVAPAEPEPVPVPQTAAVAAEPAQETTSSGNPGGTDAPGADAASGTVADAGTGVDSVNSASPELSASAGATTGPTTGAIGGTSREAAVPAAVSAAGAQTIAGPVLEVVFLEDSWTEISAPDGSQLFYNLGRAGTSVRLAADPAMNLFFGNAAGVELRLDGAVIAIPASVRRRDDLAQFDLSAILD